MLVKIKNDSIEFEKAVIFCKEMTGEITASKAILSMILQIESLQNQAAETHARLGKMSGTALKLKDKLEKVSKAIVLLNDIEV
jgi:hypothetical protein